MSIKPHKTYKLSDKVTEIFHEIFNHHEIDLKQLKNNCQRILHLSQVYQNELQDHSNIWKTKNLLQAYLLYYMPLNVLRTSSVMTEAFSFLPPSQNLDIYDYGSGPGTSHLSLLNNQITFRKVFNFDCAREPLQIHQTWSRNRSSEVLAFTDNINQWTDINNESLGVFNYSYNELGSLPPGTFNHNHLLLIEPSTQKTARRLQSLRKDLFKQGYSAIAPCTHQLGCPLLEHSKKDWCHNRIFIELPPWHKELENRLPMKNKTVTYSYLFLSKTLRKNENTQLARVIGDTLFEKGKTRQAVCRSDQREFLAWLKKNGKAPILPRGSLYKVAEEAEYKGNEIRP